LVKQPLESQLPVMLAEWESRCSMLKRTVRVRIEDKTLTGVARGIADDGALVLVLEGKEQRVYAGEVTILSS